MSRADELFIQNCKEILTHGVWDTDQNVRPKWEDGAPAHTVKAFGIVNRYDLREEFPIQTIRRMYLKSAVDELLWIWQKKSNNIKDLKSGIWDAWADETGSINGHRDVDKEVRQLGEKLLDTLLRRYQGNVGAGYCEQPASHHPRNVVDHSLERCRLADCQTRDVENLASVVSNETRTELGLSTQLHKPTRHRFARHGNDLDRQWKFPQTIDHFRFIDNANETLGDRGHDFFPRERAPAAFDHVQRFVDFVGAININRHRADVIEIEYRYAQRFHAGRAAL